MMLQWQILYEPASSPRSETCSVFYASFIAHVFVFFKSYEGRRQLRMPIHRLDLLKLKRNMDACMGRE